MENKDKKVARLPKRPSQCDPAPAQHPTDQALALPVVAAARRPATCAPMKTAAHVSTRLHVRTRNVFELHAPRPSLTVMVDCISGQAA